MNDDTLTFRDVLTTNVARMHRWHGEKTWTPERWATAMTGEIGEACNALKKLFRIEDGYANINVEPGRQLTERTEAIAKIGEELADAFLYMGLLADSLDIDLPS